MGLVILRGVNCPWTHPLPPRRQDELEEVRQVREDRLPDGGAQVPGEGEDEMGRGEKRRKRYVGFSCHFFLGPPL